MFLHVQVVIAGGEVANGLLSSTEIYNASSQASVGAASLAEPRARAGSALLSDGQVLIGGGLDPPVRNANIPDESFLGAWANTTAPGASFVTDLQVCISIVLACLEWCVLSWHRASTLTLLPT